MIHKVIKAGKSSLAVIIPAKFIHALGIKHGDRVKIGSRIEKGTINMKFFGALQLRLPTEKSPQKKKS